ncbi:uncharacterized protein [Neodiprion pinetum]|uniref:uncharacterized protein n=1 Tax=Neodiprion pinetum TaxID=441929 RepID=UPI001EE01CBF|nr:uncharacterized protein LOC124217257 [Neodiprion pinetum]
MLSSHLAGNCNSNSLLDDLIIPESLTTRLNLEKGHSTLDVYGVGGKRTSQIRGIVTLALHSRYRTLSVKISAHVLKTLTTVLPSSEVHSKLTCPHLKGLNLADPEFLTPRAMDVIVGADFYEQLIKPNIIRHSSSSLIAQLTIFGWLIIGPIYAPVTLAKTAHHVVSQATNSSLQYLLTRFWVQEEQTTLTKPQLTPEEEKSLGDSHHTAHLCLQRIFERLDRDSQYHQLYTRFMLEYERADHMIKLDDNSISRRPHYYLLHHGVLKPDSSTTKLRVVFNGSSASSTGYSLNDLMHAGPNLMVNIFHLLIWIR